MKGLVIGLVLIAVFSDVVAQQTQNRNLPSFSGIKAAEGIDVYLIKGERESAKIVATNIDMDDVLTEVSGSYLKIHLDGNHRNFDVKVYVTYVRLDKISASSAGSVFSQSTIRANSLFIDCSSAGTVELTIETGKVEVDVSSAGEVELKGKTRLLTIDTSSAGEADTYDLEADEVVAEASSGGSIKLQVGSSLVGNASSGGSIRFRGDPGKSITNATSGGSVKKSN